MAFNKLKYDAIKQIKTDLEEEIVLVKKIYNQDTGELEHEAENAFDLSVIPERISALQAEINNLQDLKTKIDTQEFDVIEDKRTQTVKE